MSSFRLERIQLVNFKSYHEATVDFRGTIHCLVGRNGSGKTNLLEAIHYLSFTKGLVNAGDAFNVRHQEESFQINGRFNRDGKISDVSCTFSGGKKTVAENGKNYTRFSSHIGKYPLVLVAPNDIELIWDGAEIRRKFFDSLMAQLDKDYLEHLISYQSHLRQRNSLLKMSLESGQLDRSLLEMYDDKIVATGESIFQKRLEFVKSFSPMLISRYQYLIKGDGEETVEIDYQSDLKGMDFRTELGARIDTDLSLGRTTIGPHRDDFLFNLNGHPMKLLGSQGQQKSMLIALKLAEFDCLVNRNNSKPLLLLDDIFDKLDDSRIQRLMELVSDGIFGQVFLTDARAERSKEIFLRSGVSSQNFLVEDGKLTEL